MALTVKAGARYDTRTTAPRKGLTTGLPTSSRKGRRGEISPYSRLESGSEGIANVVVDCQQLLTSEGHRSDANHRDKRGDQAIFDGGHASFISEKTGDKLVHVTVLELRNQRQRGCCDARALAR